MKQLSFIIIFVLPLLWSCGNNADSKYFNGPIVPINDIAEEEKVSSQRIELNGITAGFVAAYDSLAIFWYWDYPGAYFSIFNMNDGAHLGYYCLKGRGPQETLGVPPIYQFYQEGGELKTLLLAFNNDKLLFWNITKSIQENATVFDTIVPYDWRKDHLSAYTKISRLDDNTLLGFVPQEYTTLSNTLMTLPVYEKRTIFSNELLDTYTPFKESITGGDAKILPDFKFLNTSDGLKPDGTKIAQSMFFLQQIHIIDLDKNKVTGYRIKGTPDFSMFKQVPPNCNYYYHKLQCDDNFIYTLYYGKEHSSFNRESSCDMVHVFDWDGNLVKKLELEHPAQEIWLDRETNRLYTYFEPEEAFCRIDLNDVMKR